MARSGPGPNRSSSNGRPNKSFRSKGLNSKTKTSAATAAANGYAKRHARKIASSDARNEEGEVYEYAPDKVRRSKIAMDLDREEEMDFGAGGENDMDMEDFRMKARLIGENEENEKIDSDDDEEIDSDAAFDDEDDERFAGFFSKKVLKTKKKSSVRFAEVDLNEDAEESAEADGVEGDEDDDGEESGEDDEFIDVLDILDGRGEPLNDDDDGKQPALQISKPSASQESDDDDEEEDDNIDDDKISITLSDAEDEAVGALDDLQTFISSLDPTSTKKRKAAEVNEPDQSTKKRRTLIERTEAGVESEFRTQSAGLSLTDLLAPLAGQSSSSSFQKTIKALQSGSGDASGKRKSKAQTLSVPLPQRTQERLDREAAYEQTKEEVDKWSATMKRIAEAEHLSFPLQQARLGRVSNLELAAKFKPTTTLESTVSSLLSSANLATDASVLETEENILKTNAISIDDVADRRRQLRRMRELMFRAEVKAKRVKKIKSKVYRRLKRKGKEAAAAVDDDGDGTGDDEEVRLKKEIERARERATLKHKNTGKWAKKMMHRNGYGEGEDGDEDMRGGRQEIEEMLERGEKLRRKIQGRGSDDSDSDINNGDEDDEGQEQDLGGAFDELQALKGRDEVELTEAGKQKSNSVFGMKFMKDAMARKQAETGRMVDDFVKEMGMGGNDDDDDESPSSQEVNTDIGADGNMVSRTGNGGRMVFQPGFTSGSKPNPTRTFSVASEETSSSTTLKSTDILPSSSSVVPSTSRSLLSQPPLQSSATAPPSFAPTPPVINPWLAPTNSSGPGPSKTKKKNQVIVDKASSQPTKAKHKLQKQVKKNLDEREKARDDAVVEIEMEDILVAAEGAEIQNAKSKAKGKEKGISRGKEKKEKTRASSNDSDSESDKNSEVEEQEKILQTKGKKSQKVKAFEQRQLVARAFAGDNVVQDFEEAKRREIAMDAPKEVDTTLPGWGSWGGSGTRKSIPKPHLIKKLPGIDPKSRSDANKSHIIISEKRDKKAAKKYLVQDLPFPYTSKAQFDRRMQQPLGPEWNTRVGFQRGTLPKVVKKMGTIIDPLEKI